MKNKKGVSMSRILFNALSPFKPKLIRYERVDKKYSNKLTTSNNRAIVIEPIPDNCNNQKPKGKLSGNEEEK
jgi:hypothetical protein